MPSERRLHPLAIVFDILRQIGALAVPLLLLLFGVSSEGIGSELIAALMLLPYGAMAVGRYLTFRYRYDDRDLVIRSGLLTKNERHIPYERIQNIDAVQNVLHRMFGVVEVRVQTGSGNEAEATFGAVPIAALDEMRAHVFARRSARAAVTEPLEGDASSLPVAEEAAPPRRLLRLGPRDLIAYGVIENRGFIVIAAAFGLLWEVGPASGMFEEVAENGRARGVIRSFARQFAADGSLFYLALAIPLLVLGLMIVSRMFSIVWALVQLHAFTLSRAGEDLRTEYGWLTRVTATVPLRRIQTVTVREGLWHRLLGRASVRASTAGGTGPESSRPQREWLAPILDRSQVTTLVSDVLPGIDMTRIDWQPVHPRAFRRAIKGRLVGAAIAVGALAFALGARLVGRASVRWLGAACRAALRAQSWLGPAG